MRRASILLLLMLAGCPDATPPPVVVMPPPTPPTVEPLPAPAPRVASPWRTLAIGTFFETRILTHLEKPIVLENVTTQRQTLSARDGSFGTVKVELTTNGMAMAPYESRVSLDLEPSLALDASDETVTVPAGRFACRKTTVETKEGELATTTETWTAKDLPVPVKRVVKNANLTSTLELTKVEKKE